MAAMEVERRWTRESIALWEVGDVSAGYGRSGWKTHAFEFRKVRFVYAAAESSW